MSAPEQTEQPGQKRKFIVYVDESGDHSLAKIDDGYPVFVLAFCVFYQENYVKNVVSAIEKLKFQRFGHDIVILHERDIRKEIGPFKFRYKEEKEAFMNDLTKIIDDSKFILIASVIDKRALSQGDAAANPYHIALGFCLESLKFLMAEKNQENVETYVVFERRGDKEDKELELEFRRICDGANSRDERLPFQIVFADKKVNSAGLQLADLVARPIGINFLRPTQLNRAFETLRPKFLCREGRESVGKHYEGLGLKIYPSPTSEKPR